MILSSAAPCQSRDKPGVFKGGLSGRNTGPAGGAEGEVASLVKYSQQDVAHDSSGLWLPLARTRPETA